MDRALGHSIARTKPHRGVYSAPSSSCEIHNQPQLTCAVRSQETAPLGGSSHWGEEPALRPIQNSDILLPIPGVGM